MSIVKKIIQTTRLYYTANRYGLQASPFEQPPHFVTLACSVSGIFSANNPRQLYQT
ncbi:MAG: hypothetical protein LBJ00_17110 [Planctomycetaceae bacterium]|nr:hypothetical protein [Planctomycetaceae bacterium]